MASSQKLRDFARERHFASLASAAEQAAAKKAKLQEGITGLAELE